MARTYNQDCILAHALDLLGERWTLLIMRELFLGPQRFGDLQAGLPGIGANLLSKRLKELEEAGLIDASSGDSRGRYRLSDIGEGLRPTVHKLMKWSINYFLMQNQPSAARDCLMSNDLQPDSVALAIEIFADQRRNPDLSYVAHMHIDGFAYTFFYMHEMMTARRGADAPAIAHISADVDTIMRSFRGELSMSEAKSRMTMSGEQKVLDHLLACIVHDKKDYAVMPQNEASAVA